MSALRLINETSIGTPVNRISIEDVFSADYDIYCIQVTDTLAGTQRENNSMDIQLINSSNSVVTDSIYDSEMVFARGFSGTYLSIGNANRDDFGILYHDNGAQNGNGNMIMWVFNPFQSDTYTFQVQQSIGRMSYPSTTQVSYMSKGIGVLKQKSSITGYSFHNRDSYNINLGTFRTYGLRVD